VETATYIFSSDKLAAAVKAVAGVIPGKRCPKSILHNLRLRGMERAADNPVRGIEAYATDLETAVIVRVGDCDGETIAETLVPVETAKAIGKAKGGVSITPNGETIEALGARVPVGDPMEYPAAPEAIDAGFAAWLPFESIRRMDDHIANATDNESSRYALGGILLERRDGERLVRAVGTDGRRLHVLTVDDGGSDKGPLAAIVYPSAVRLFRKAVQAVAAAIVGKGGKAAADYCDGASVGVRTRAYPSGSTEVEFSWRAADCHVRVVTRAVEGRFPRWRDCFPSTAFEPSPVMIPMPAGREQIVAAARCQSEMSKGVKFAAGRLSAKSADKGEYDAPFVGTMPEHVKVKLDPPFLLNMIDGATDGRDAVGLHVWDEKSAASVQSGGGLAPNGMIGFAAVLIPLAAD
jgi:DNA polymerase-3 subunit beta